MPIIVRNKSSLEVCSVTNSGIGLMTGVVQKLGWAIDDYIQVEFIEKVRCILLSKSPTGEGFKLAYSNKSKKTGGRIYCGAFVRNYLQTIVEIPKKNIHPVYLSDSEWKVALVLEDVDQLKGSVPFNCSHSNY